MAIAEPVASTPACPSVAKPAQPTTCTPDVPAEVKDRKLSIGKNFLQSDIVPCDVRDLWIVAGNERVAVCAKWSVEPAGLATIDDNGRLVVSAAAGGRMLFVTARLANDEALSTTIPVADASVAPLVGNWHEEARLSCDSKLWLPPPEPIRELHVSASGGFSVTWTPSESYVDYSGDYTYDGNTGALKLANLAGNYVPKDVVTKGTARVENGKLVLSAIWLGTKQSGGETRACGHRFAK